MEMNLALGIPSVHDGFMVMERNQRLSIRISQEEWRMLQELAEKEGLCASDFVRSFIRKTYAVTFGEPRKTPTSEG